MSIYEKTFGSFFFAFYKISARFICEKNQNRAIFTIPEARELNIAPFFIKLEILASTEMRADRITAYNEIRPELRSLSVTAL